MSIFSNFLSSIGNTVKDIGTSAVQGLKNIGFLYDPYQSPLRTGNQTSNVLASANPQKSPTPQVVPTTAAMQAKQNPTNPYGSLDIYSSSPGTAYNPSNPLQSLGYRPTSIPTPSPLTQNTGNTNEGFATQPVSGLTQAPPQAPPAPINSNNAYSGMSAKPAPLPGHKVENIGGQWVQVALPQGGSGISGTQTQSFAPANWYHQLNTSAGTSFGTGKFFENPGSVGLSGQGGAFSSKLGMGSAAGTAALNTTVPTSEEENKTRTIQTNQASAQNAQNQVSAPLINLPGFPGYTGAPNNNQAPVSQVPQISQNLVQNQNNVQNNARNSIANTTNNLLSQDKYQQQTQTTNTPTSLIDTATGAVDIGNQVAQNFQNLINSATDPTLKQSYQQMLDTVNQAVNTQKQIIASQDGIPDRPVLDERTMFPDVPPTAEFRKHSEAVQNKLGIIDINAQIVDVQRDLQSLRTTLRGVLDAIDKNPNYPVGLAKRRMQSINEQFGRREEALQNQLSILTQQRQYALEEYQREMSLYQSQYAADLDAYDERHNQVKEYLNNLIDTGALGQYDDASLDLLAQQLGVDAYYLKSIAQTVRQGNEQKAQQQLFENNLAQSRETRLSGGSGGGSTGGSGGGSGTSRMPTGINKIFSSSQYAQMNAAGLGPELANDIANSILSGDTLESIRQALREGGRDPVVLDVFDRFINIRKLLGQPEPESDDDSDKDISTIINSL